LSYRKAVIMHVNVVQIHQL